MDSSQSDYSNNMRYTCQITQNITGRYSSNNTWTVSHMDSWQPGCSNWSSYTLQNYS